MDFFKHNLESKEAEQRPDLIIDFIRHGKTVYGNALKQEIKRIGQDPDSLKLMPPLDESIKDTREQLEGRVTEEGEMELREAIKKLAVQIDRENELVVIVHGTRTRHEQSSDIIADELQKNGIDVVKSRKHKDLVDVQGGGWYTFVDYIINHQGKTAVDLEQFWWEMYQSDETRDDMTAKGFEHLGGVADRVEHFTGTLKRFVKRFNLGKTLRVIAVTSDINIEQIQQRGAPLKERDQVWVKNGEVYEIKEFNDKLD